MTMWQCQLGRSTAPFHYRTYLRWSQVRQWKLVETAAKFKLPLQPHFPSMTVLTATNKHALNDLLSVHIIHNDSLTRPP